MLEWVATGRADKLIAAELAIFVGTIKAHMKAILSKLHASTRTEAASIARHRGLIGDSFGNVAGARSAIMESRYQNRFAPQLAAFA